MSEQKSQEWSTFLQQKGTELVNRLYMFFRTSKIYEPNNTLFIKQISEFVEGVEKIFRQEETVAFRLSQTTLYLNKIKIKFGFSNYHLFKFINQEFQKRNISSLTFFSGLKEEELNRFVFLLTRTESTEEFQEKFKTGEFSHISLEGFAEDNLNKKKKSAAKVYFLSLTHLKEYLEKKRQFTPSSLLTTRRLMQSLFNNLVENEPFLHGMTTIKNFDEYTLNHSVNVCILSLALGKRLGLDRNELMALGISAFFHDVGKLEIPKEILNKPGKLDEKERRLIETHPHLGVQWLIHSQEYRGLPLQALQVAMEHHSREDLKGYPRYRRKKNVNLYSKIVKIVDYFDAITTKRPYRKKVFTRSEALSLMMEKVGTEFDPLLFKAFVGIIGPCPVGTFVLLDTGETGIAYETNPEPSLLLRPKIKLVSDEKGKKIDGPIVDLTEKDESLGNYLRTIVKTLNPEKFNIKIPDYFMAEVA